MKRRKDESYEDYKLRRSTTQREINRRLKGKWLWKSENGTYIKNKEE